MQVGVASRPCWPQGAPAPNLQSFAEEDAALGTNLQLLRALCWDNGKIKGIGNYHIILHRGYVGMMK